MPMFKHLDGSQFEIPDQWWREAGMERFNKEGASYRGDEATEFYALLTEIEPPRREAGKELDFAGFRRDKMSRVLRYLVCDAPMEPIPLVEGRSATHRFIATDGFHRYHASLALGLVSVPARKGWLPET